MAFTSSTLTWTAAIYVLVLSAISFYMIYLSTQVQTRLRASDWVKSKNLENTEDLQLLQNLTDSTYNLSVSIVVINFFAIAFMIFNNYKISIRA